MLFKNGHYGCEPHECQRLMIAGICGPQTNNKLTHSRDEMILLQSNASEVYFQYSTMLIGIK